MFKNRLLMRLMEQAVAGDEGAAGAGATTEQPGAEAGAAAGENATDASLLQTGKTGEQAGADQHFIPEKYHVKKEDGSIDLEASSKKLAEAHGHLEKKLGSNEPPPATAADYTFTPPDELKDVFTADDPLLKGFIEDAHKLGFSQKQMDAAMTHLFKFVPGLVAGNAAVSQEEARAELLQDWGDEATMNKNLGLANKAFTAYVDAKDAEAIDKLAGNNPALLRMLAKIGKELGEDHPVNTSQTVTETEEQQIKQLMASEAYINPRHPDHASISSKVKTFFDKKYPGQLQN